MFFFFKQKTAYEMRISDWSSDVCSYDLHITTAFPDVRLKRFLEMRGADGGPWRRICALPAFWVGLLYDEGALDAADELTANWSYDDVLALRDAVPAAGLKAEIAGRPLLDGARAVRALSAAGLQDRQGGRWE